MMPDFMPAKRELVYFTGVCELLAVVGLLWDKTAKLTAVLLIIFFIAILPANVIGSLKEVEFRRNGKWCDVSVFPNSFADFVYRVDLLFWLENQQRKLTGIKGIKGIFLIFFIPVHPFHPCLFILFSRVGNNFQG